MRDQEVPHLVVAPAEDRIDPVHRRPPGVTLFNAPDAPRAGVGLPLAHEYGLELGAVAREGEEGVSHRGRPIG